MKSSLNKTSKAVLVCTVVIIALSIGGLYIVSAEDQIEGSVVTETNGFFTMRGWRMPFRHLGDALTEEQRNELFSEIQDLVWSKFEEWGIEPPEPLLSEDQHSELQAGVEQLIEDGATREEIREYVAGKLEEWGVELPEISEDFCGYQRRGNFMRERSGGMWKRRFPEDTG